MLRSVNIRVHDGSCRRESGSDALSRSDKAAFGSGVLQPACLASRRAARRPPTTSGCGPVTARAASPLTELGRPGASTTNAVKECAADDPAFTEFGDGMRTSLPAGRQASSWRFDVPPNLSLQEVRALPADHRARRRPAVRAQDVAQRRAREPRTPVRRRSAARPDFTPTAPAPISATRSRFGLTCDRRVPATPAARHGAVLDVSAVAMQGRRRPPRAAMRRRAACAARPPARSNARGPGDRHRLRPALRRRRSSAAPSCTEQLRGRRRLPRPDARPPPRVDMSIDADCADVSLGLKLGPRHDRRRATAAYNADREGRRLGRQRPREHAARSRCINTRRSTRRRRRSASAPPASDAGRHEQQRRLRRRRRRLGDRLPLAAPVGVPGPEAAARLGRRAGAQDRQALPLHRPPDLRDQRSPPVGAEAHARSTCSTRSASGPIEKSGTTIRDKGGLTVILAYKSSRIC